MATIKVKLKDKKDNGIFYMLFGDSYKKWQEQFQEYMRYHKDDVEPIAFYKSNSQWKGFGGLKWCSEESFQMQLNREDVQANEPDNPNPRKYSDFSFKEFSYHV